MRKKQAKLYPNSFFKQFSNSSFYKFNTKKAIGTNFIKFLRKTDQAFQRQRNHRSENNFQKTLSIGNSLEETKLKKKLQNIQRSTFLIKLRTNENIDLRKLTKTASRIPETTQRVVEKTNRTYFKNKKKEESKKKLETINFQFFYESNFLLRNVVKSM